MEIHVTSRNMVNLLVSNLSITGAVGVISIVDPNGFFPPIKCDSILRLQFHDLNKVWPELEGKVTYFDDKMADEIVGFVNRNTSIDHIVIHCEAGVSRSPAIAAAICEHINKHHMFFRTHCPNTMVFSILRVKFGF